jgi:hypothetical protein
MSEENASYETKDEALKSDASFVTFWLDAIDAAGKEEKDWRESAQKVLDIYRGEDKGETEFNIVYSNVETLLPAIYNSTPVPDVRRRFGDRDPIAKTVADMLERAISYSLDSYDFDNTMRNVLFDSAVPGRGVARVRYIPYMGEDEQVAYEEATCEYVPWKHFRHGAARVWDEVPWICFEHFLSRDQLRQINPELAEQVQLDCSTKGEDAEAKPDESDVFKRARVWEIWDKDQKEVVFIATGYRQEALSRQSDPLGLTGFYPIPRPVQPISTPGKLCPVTPYTAYKTLAEELNSITLRIRKLVRQIRVKAGYASMGADLDALARADDGELVPLANLEAIAAGGGDLNKLLAWWPIEPQVKALAQLYTQREAIKQTIYEVTGISDIVRGSTMASETATAQQIKAQWGSLRIQRLQAEVQRFARDLFRLKAEIFATKFDIKNLSMITSIPVLPMAQIQQAQAMAAQAEQMGQPVPDELKQALKAAPLEPVEQIMKSDLMRAYKIDVESDSTIRADLTRNQEQMSYFVQGTAQYMRAAVAVAQVGVPVEPLVEIYSAFARNFKLGKQAEDALDRMGEEARQPKPPRPDPEMEKAKMQMQMEQMKLQSTQQLEQAKLQGQMQLEQVKLQGQMQMEDAKMQSQFALEQQRMELDREKVGMQLGFEQQKMQADYSLKSSAQEADIAIKREGQAADQELAREAQAMTPAQNGDTPGPRSKKAAMGPIGDAIKALGEMMIEQSAKAEQRHAESMDAIAAGQAQMVQIMAAPQKVIRDRNGQVIGAAKDIRVN